MHKNIYPYIHEAVEVAGSKFDVLRCKGGASSEWQKSQVRKPVALQIRKIVKHIFSRVGTVIFCCVFGESCIAISDYFVI